MIVKPWTEDESQLLFDLKKSGKTYKDIAHVLTTSYGRRTYTVNSCKKKWNDTNWDVFKKNKQRKTKMIEISEDTEQIKQKIIDTALKNNEKLIKRDQGRTQIIIDNCKAAIYRIPKPKSADYTYPKSRSSKKYRAEHLGVVLSDLHIGESYTLEDTGGLAEYNLSIFKQRLERMKKSVFEITERHRLMYDIPELHIFCLGDIVAGASGTGAWNDNYINLSIFDQLFEGTEALRNTIAAWSKNFKKVHFYGIYGNHGRVSKKGQEKHSTNWDRICYTHVKTSMQNYSNITWNIPEAWWLQTSIQNHNFYLCHGDGIRGSMGLPYYGVERAEAKIVGLMDKKPDYLLMGHFHSPAEIQTNSSRVIMNGSFMSGDMYSLKDLGRGGVPEQKVFGIHAKKGITWTYNIYLDQD